MKPQITDKVLRERVMEILDLMCVQCIKNGEQPVKHREVCGRVFFKIDCLEAILKSEYVEL